MTHDNLESRSGGSPYGKCTEPANIMLAEDTSEKLIMLARLNNMSKAEYARLVLERHVYGAASQIERTDPLMR